MSKKSEHAEEQANAFKMLHKWLKPGATIYCVSHHTSASGMSRDIGFLIPYKEGKNVRIIDASYYIGLALAYPRGKRGGLRVGGCGMDMGFSVVYNLGSAMWPKGTAKPHGTRNGSPDSAGGYALKSTWL